RPQVHDIGVQAREAVVVAADLAGLVAGDAAGERHLAVGLEQRRVVEALAAGDEASADLVAGPVRTALAVEAGGDHLEAGAVLLRLDADDAAAPAHQGAGGVARRGLVRGDAGVLS